MQHQIINTIRHSLNAAQSALSLLEILQPTAPVVSTNDQIVAQHSVVETVETATELVERDVVPVETPAVPSAFDMIMSELNHPRYTLRTLNELANKVGVSADKVKSILNDNSVNYVTKRRRSDSAVLIGLSNRN